MQRRKKEVESLTSILNNKKEDNMFSFEQIEAARSQLAKEYSFVGNLTKDYRINVKDLIPYTDAMDRIRELRKVINS